MKTLIQSNNSTYLK